MEPLHDWVPLCETLDWRLGLLAYQARGTLTFTTNEVPNIAHQGGLIPYRAAEVLLAACQAAHDAGTLRPDDEIFCLELGMGLGLFAAQVLDRFKARCAALGVDWPRRLRWLATDATAAVLRDVQASGILRRHADCVRFARASALQPTLVHPLDGGPPQDLSGRLLGVFHSYVLCMLPMGLYRVEGDQITATVARTCISDPALLPRFTHLSLAQLRALVARDDPQAVLPLVGLYPLLDLELATAPIDPQAADTAARVRQIAAWLRADLDPDAPDAPVWVLDSAGAAQSLAATTAGLHPDGFLLYRDYGPHTPEDASRQQLYQHYGATIAVQVNHLALERLLAPVAQFTAPPGEGERLLTTRRLTRQPLPRVQDTFRRAYDLADVEALKTAIEAARAAPPEQTVARYQAALALEPDNWALLTEAADAIYARLRDPAQAYGLLKRSLDINDATQATAWCLLGEMFLDAREWTQARAALERAARINPEHARVYTAQARLHEALGAPEEALVAAARALAWADPEQVSDLTARLQALQAALEDRHALERRLREQRLAGGWHRRLSL